jgi:predicted kinase
VSQSEISNTDIKPMCIIVTGRPGSGKSTLAKELGARLWLPVLSRDELKEGYVNTHGVAHDQLPADTNRIVSDLFFELINGFLAGRISIVVEAAFQHKVWEARMEKILQLGAPFIIVCSVSATMAAHRHLQRGLDVPQREFYHGDARVAAYRASGQMPPPGEYDPPDFDVPTLSVSTDGEYSPSTASIVEQIGQWRRRAH